MTRFAVATFAAPLVPVVLVALLAFNNARPINDIGLAALWSYLGSLVLGVPAFLICRRRNWLQWWQVGLCGVATGALAPLLQMSLFIVLAALGGASSIEALLQLAPVIAVCAALGGGIAMAFWLIARPEQTNAP